MGLKHRTVEQIRRDRRKREAKRYRQRRVERVLFDPNFWGWIGIIVMLLLFVFFVVAPHYLKG